MASQTHKLLRTLRANKPAFGAWLTLPGAFNARTVAQASPHLSWVAIDCEHGLTSLHPGVAESVLAVTGVTGGPSPLVRVPATGASTGTSWQIKYALDAGAHGIIVPMVGTADKAREIVADSRFAPRGRRGFGSPHTPGVWSLSAAEYIQAATEDVLVIIQIETQEAVHNLEQIATVDGVDVLFIGPYDLSLSLGYTPPAPDVHPEVEKVIQRILTVGHQSGKKVAIYCTSGAAAAKRAQEGFDLVNVVTDSGAISEFVSTNLAVAAGV
ncbi:Pyruvate/Phosphoenolpyruvate kinase-like domain-containing protein [Vararia minispora EC-137]|uniref:Pyruvate/Phosphoenolpyruvate kinase-like domain-containing protein n=1 Tax=Vararia minispora EC-137 TaxID=1314806 RepID=A0ACB8QZ75_9AGAM|nr:Pyruvate/Phosphoenolpyruvate kinase-like domain-containing protein [Vararia minispora EC-137]